jgi:cation transport regulator ChaC
LLAAAHRSDPLVGQIADQGINQRTVRDLVLGIFLLLEHTPFDKMGINRDMHFRMPTEEAWHQLGHLLTPKELWRSHLEKPGMQSITIGGSPEHAPDSYLRVKVEPSTRVKPCGVYVGTNQQHQASGSDAARQLMAILREKWVNAKVS